jgi:hypothetical protein
MVTLKLLKLEVWPAMEVVTSVSTSELIVELVLLAMAYRHPVRAALLSKFQSIKNLENSKLPNMSEVTGIRIIAVSGTT